MGENDTHQQVKTPENEEDVENEVGDTTENNSIREAEDNNNKQQAKRMAGAKKGMRITKALITFGHESWIAFEPGKHKLLVVSDGI